MNEKRLPPEALEEWAAELADLLDLDPDSLDIEGVLNLASIVASQVARPAAPLSAFAAGLAAGRSGASEDAVADALEAVIERAEAWDSE